MIRFKVTGVSGETLAKRIMKLAWDRAGVFGMGALQDRGSGMSEDDVWNNTRTRGDYRFGMALDGPPVGKASADYVFGRMMKLNFTYGPDFVEGTEQPYRSDYQSFCRKFPNFESLVKGAAESLSATVEKV